VSVVHLQARVLPWLSGFSMAKGELDIDTLKDCSSGQFTIDTVGGHPYSQTKLAQHVWCKEAGAGGRGPKEHAHCTRHIV
jgi:hypothetical protein